MFVISGKRSMGKNGGNFWFAVVAGMVLLTLFSACARKAPGTAPDEVLYLSLESGDYDRLAYVEGSSCVPRYMIFFRMDSPNILDAVTQAMKQAPEANFLMNRHVSFQEEVVIPLLYHRVCLFLQARAVRLKAPQGDTP